MIGNKQGIALQLQEAVGVHPYDDPELVESQRVIGSQLRYLQKCCK